jgi:hypothetical protein
MLLVMPSVTTLGAAPGIGKSGAGEEGTKAGGKKK